MTDNDHDSNCLCYGVASEAMEQLEWLRLTILELMEEKPRAVNGLLEILREEIEGSVIPALQRLIYDMEDGHEEEALCEHNDGCFAHHHKDLRSPLPKKSSSAIPDSTSYEADDEDAVDDSSKSKLEWFNCFNIFVSLLYYFFKSICFSVYSLREKYCDNDFFWS